MCEHGTTVVIDGHDIDSCIAPIVGALNDAGIATKASCCGHDTIPGSIVLADGRDLRITQFDQANYAAVGWWNQYDGSHLYPHNAPDLAPSVARAHAGCRPLIFGDVTR